MKGESISLHWQGEGEVPMFVRELEGRMEDLEEI